MYEFRVGGKRPRDPKALRYVLPDAFEHGDSGDLTLTAIGSLGLKVKDAFFYWFDFGDDWWHQIKVAAIFDEFPPGNYPKVIERIGANPPQYIYGDEEEEDE